MLVDQLYDALTHPDQEVGIGKPPPRPHRAIRRPYQALPHVTVDALSGLVEELARRGGREDTFELARDLQYEVDDLLPLIQGLELLDLATAVGGDVQLTRFGRHFAEAETEERKALFRDRVRNNVQLVREILRRLDETEDGVLDEDVVLEGLAGAFSPGGARAQLDTAIDWGRYAELFGHEDSTGQLYKESFEAKEPAQP
jgi:NitT/TauT family transport system ATP-binding protein